MLYRSSNIRISLFGSSSLHLGITNDFNQDILILRGSLVFGSLSTHAIQSGYGMVTQPSSARG
jgi:hypothetical protein